MFVANTSTALRLCLSKRPQDLFIVKKDRGKHSHTLAHTKSMLADSSSSTCLGDTNTHTLFLSFFLSLSFSFENCILKNVTVHTFSHALENLFPLWFILAAADPFFVLFQSCMPPQKHTPTLPDIRVIH